MALANIQTLQLLRTILQNHLLNSDTPPNININFYTIKSMSEVNSEEYDSDSGVESVDDNDDPSKRYNFIEFLNEDDAIELDIQVYEYIEEYIQSHVGKMHYNKFHENLVHDAALHFLTIYSDIGVCNDDDDNDYDSLHEFVEERCFIYFHTISSIPVRSQPYTLLMQSANIPKLSAQIEYLRAIPQPTQRTKEWYEFRYNLFTASNIGKLFSTEAQANSLICEKCKPLDYAASLGQISTESPLHWGVKYEPLTIMYYEKRFRTTVGDFGCIPHPKYKCIGASPDGINIDPTTDRYGRMVEVKNVVNREINGIPIDMYWIQMQLQMETCDLDECDFIETQFKEYPGGESEFYADDTNSDRGVILYFVKKTVKGVAGNSSYNVPHYVYMPLSTKLEKEVIDKWVRDKRDELKSEYSLYTTLYWYLAEVSCVLVQRNREWFAESVDIICKAWDTVVKERISGYEHRMSKKKREQLIVTNSSDDNSSDKQIKNLVINNSVCLVKLDA